MPSVASRSVPVVAAGLALAAKLHVADGSVKMANKQTWALALLGLLMTSHLTFLGFRSDKPTEFQRAAETYVTLLLALMTPLPTK